MYIADPPFKLLCPYQLINRKRQKKRHLDESQSVTFFTLQ